MNKSVYVVVTVVGFGLFIMSVVSLIQHPVPDHPKVWTGAEKDQPTIAGMHEGDVRWTLPWGLVQGDDGRLWLRTDYPANNSQNGTVSMQVKHCFGGGYSVLAGGEGEYISSSSLRWLMTVGAAPVIPKEKCR